MKNLIFAVDLGGTTNKLAILTDSGDFVHKWEIPTDISENGKYIVENIGKAFSQKIQELKLTREQFCGVGMGAPGPVVPGGIISKAVNLGWENFPLKTKLEEELQLPAFVGNDANCAALGEMWKGAGKGLDNLVCVTLGTGVGGGVITNGNIVEGANGGAGEIGHISVQLENGFQCNCGKRGCLETVASATGIVRLAMEEMKNTENSPLKDLYLQNGAVTSKDVFDYAAKEDAIALKVVDKLAFYIGYAIGTLSTVLNPNAVVIGGGVSKAGNALIEPVEKYYEKFAFPPSSADTKIILATLGNDAGVIGAGWLVKKNILEDN
ncbi:ROK family glucokinase [Caldibacillus lycopersici]|uniref:Glucokinase n=1 Tax=Perspicuibacillus lycopersici TaxID=1325689 RepID=A0AAE3LNH9_9BACI|nr:ROK family glucokinase [Perspicuibacillus lycopersici]MCU9613872.1 ROK family glucokinase [Perspicuibacillus lycopersici]